MGGHTGLRLVCLVRHTLGAGTTLSPSNDNNKKLLRHTNTVAIHQDGKRMDEKRELKVEEFHRLKWKFLADMVIMGVQILIAPAMLVWGINYFIPVPLTRQSYLGAWLILTSIYLAISNFSLPWRIWYGLK